jgi:hypothetical protein
MMRRAILELRRQQWDPSDLVDITRCTSNQYTQARRILERANIPCPLDNDWLELFYSAELNEIEDCRDMEPYPMLRMLTKVMAWVVCKVGTPSPVRNVHTTGAPSVGRNDRGHWHHPALPVDGRRPRALLRAQDRACHDRIPPNLA